MTWNPSRGAAGKEEDNGPPGKRIVCRGAPPTRNGRGLVDTIRQPPHTKGFPRRTGDMPAGQQKVTDSGPPAKPGSCRASASTSSSLQRGEVCPDTGHPLHRDMTCAPFVQHGEDLGLYPRKGGSSPPRSCGLPPRTHNQHRLFRLPDGKPRSASDESTPQAQKCLQNATRGASTCERTDNAPDQASEKLVCFSDTTAAPGCPALPQLSPYSDGVDQAQVIPEKRGRTL